ncbi:hypothetical protein [Bacillus sp. EB600]|uniref:hypothetical protein n=1 Tax=Bacillus sp. EB600 TaxID=2806345 RepID=UPI002109A087|nr:hypothetical protein [Bacillus sp. EB600]MCQ6282927.1 hypothetical protein [Bacillus sp. EB600]
MNRLCLIVFLGIIFSLSDLYNSNYTMAKNGYLFPDNKEKHFVSAREYYQCGKLKGYAQFKDANINIQQKLLYKDLQQFIKSNVNEYYYINLFNIYSNQNNNVSPDRQIYFYCSLLENDKTLKYKYIILDAETTNPQASGNRQAFKPKD